LWDIAEIRALVPDLGVFPRRPHSADGSSKFGAAMMGLQLMPSGHLGRMAAAFLTVLIWSACFVIIKASQADSLST